MGSFVDYAATLGRIGVQEHAASAADDWNTSQLRQTARTADAAAVDALARGATEAGLLRQRGAMVAGQQAVGAAAAGLDSGSGTLAGLDRAADVWSGLDAATALANARNAALGFRQTASNARGEMQQITSRSNSRQAGYVAELAGKQLNILGGFAKGGM